MPTTHVPAPNLLLTALTGLEYEQLLAISEHVELAFADVLYSAAKPIPYVYFPTGGFVSLVTHIENGANLEIGLIGNEGVVGVSLTLGVDLAPFQAVVLGAGQSLRIATPAFLDQLKCNGGLQRQMKRYLYVSMAQLAQTAACSRYHLLEARLARWLLMTQDRAHSDSFRVTHAFMAFMLGVRRVGVTKAASTLQQQQLIQYCRGDITVINRLGLEAASCSCYQAEKAIYAKILSE